MLDVYVIEETSLMVARPKDVLDLVQATRVVEFIEIKEAAWETGFNRFCDLRRVQSLQLSPRDVESLAERRRAYNPNLLHVKSAFLATTPLARDIVALYQKLLDSSRIEVRSFELLEEAAEWLGVPPSQLQL